MKINTKKMNLKGGIPHIIAIAVFVLFSVLYCLPAFQGKVLFANDVNNYIGASNETHKYSELEGRQVWWTGAMFSGMPTYQITGSTPSNHFRAQLEQIAHLGLTGNHISAGLLFGYLIGFYLMLLCFGFNVWISIAGAFALTLSSYFMIIIPAGHLTKAAGIGFLAPVIGGCYAIFRRNFRLGIPLVLIYGILGMTLHAQMTYYIFMLIGVLVTGEIIRAIKERDMRNLGISMAVFLICLLCVGATKYSWFKMNADYLSESIRGGLSELTPEDSKKEPIGQKGLDFEVATVGSYGKGETLTLLIPEFMGGSSKCDLGKGSRLEKDLKKLRLKESLVKQFCTSGPIYWGERICADGPVYVGAIVFFLFILGLILVPGYKKWTLLAATLFSIILSWGDNFEAFGRFFFNYFPLFSKFRAVESILVVAEITIPLLGFLGLIQIMKEDKKKVQKSVLTAAGITAGICLITIVCSGWIDVTSPSDVEWSNGMNPKIYEAVLAQRHSLIVSSAMRSLLFVIIGAIIIVIFNRKRDSKNSMLVFAAVLTVAVLADMLPVDRKYFSDKNFQNSKTFKNTFEIKPWEEQILQDKNLNFRVMRMTPDKFCESRTSYRLKSVGGYSAVKLRRYNDLIFRHIMPYNKEVINMLNTKYFVSKNEKLFINDKAYGNAWFVDEVRFTDTPDQENQALNILNLRTTAVADKQFEKNLTIKDGPFSDEDRIVLNKYVPDRLEYTSIAKSDRVAVFSEIYYPHGWHLYVDGKESEISRVNYVLRAAVIPAGKHNIKMEFRPCGLEFDPICFALIILSLIVSAGLILYPCFIYRKSQ